MLSSLEIASYIKIFLPDIVTALIFSFVIVRPTKRSFLPFLIIAIVSKTSSRIICHALMTPVFTFLIMSGMALWFSLVKITSFLFLKPAIDLVLLSVFSLLYFDEDKGYNFGGKTYLLLFLLQLGADMFKISWFFFRAFLTQV